MPAMTSLKITRGKTVTEELFVYYILHRPAVYDNVPKCGMYKYQTDFIYDVSYLSQVNLVLSSVVCDKSTGFTYSNTFLPKVFIQHFLVVRLCGVFCLSVNWYLHSEMSSCLLSPLFLNRMQYFYTEPSFILQTIWSPFICFIMTMYFSFPSVIISCSFKFQLHPPFRMTTS